MRVPSLIFFVCLSAFPLFAGEERGTQAQPFLSFQWIGGSTPPRNIAVEIQSSGDTEVRIKNQGKPPFSYRTELSKEEMGFLITLIASTQFFSQHNQSAALESDSGDTELAIVGDKEKKTLRFWRGSLPALDPVIQFIWRLIFQADAVTAIRADTSIIWAVSMIGPGPAHALQPDRFKEPLSLYVRTNDNPQKVHHALEGLARITTPETFAGFIANEIKDPKRRDVMLKAIPGYRSLPEEHWNALQNIDQSGNPR